MTLNLTQWTRVFKNRPKARRGARNCDSRPAMESLEHRVVMSAVNPVAQHIAAETATATTTTSNSAAPSTAARISLASPRFRSTTGTTASNSTALSSTASRARRISAADVLAGLESTSRTGTTASTSSGSRVRLVSGRDLAASSISVRETTAPYGSLITITAAVRNNGSTTVTSYQVGFTANILRTVRGDQIGDLITRNGTLRPGETDSFTVQVLLQKTSGGLAIRGNRYISMSIVRQDRDPTSNNTVTASRSIQVTARQDGGRPVTSFDRESNNSFSRANHVANFSRGSHSKTFYGSTGAGSDTQDWVSFTVSGRTSGTITLSGMAQDLDIKIYSSTGQLLSSSLNSGTRTDSFNLNGLSAGTYYLQVLPGVSGARSAYALRFGLAVSTTTPTTPTDPFDSEPNNTRGTADFVRSFGAGTHSKTYYGSTGSGSDTQDWGRFTLGGRTSGTIQLSGMSQDLDIELYNSSGTRIARSVRSGTSTDTITLTNLAAGDYYVRVVPGVSGARSAYALRFGLRVS